MGGIFRTESMIHYEVTGKSFSKNIINSLLSIAKYYIRNNDQFFQSS